MVSRAAPTVFTTTPDQTLAAVDVLTTTTSAPTNSVPATVKNIAEGVLTDVQQFFTTGNLVNFITTVGNGKNSTKEDALTELKRAVNGVKANLEDVKGELLGSLLKSVGYQGDSTALANGILGLPGSKTPEQLLLDENPRIKFVVNTLKSVRETTDIDSAQGVVSLLNSLTTNGDVLKVINLAPQFSVLNTVAQKLVEYRVPELVDAFVNSVDEDDRINVLLQGVLTAARGGDDYFIDKVLTVVNVGLVIAQHQNIVSEILSGYRFPQGRNYAESADATALVNRLNSIDPNWALISRNGQMISNASVFSFCSPAAYETLMLLPEYRAVLVIARNNPPDDITTLIQRFLPLAGI